MRRSVQLIVLSTTCASLVACKSTPTYRPDSTGVVTENGQASAVAAAKPVDIAAAAAEAAEGINVATNDARTRAVGWVSLPKQPDWKTILNPDRAPEGSFSFGTVSNGVLINAAELPFEGEGHSIIERHRNRETRWGTAELVQLIQDAATYVKVAQGGAPLRVGNLSRKKGGDMRWSSSHNSGRDADLAFFIVDATTGESVPAPDLLRFDDDGVPDGRPDLRFDVARNWKLVEGLLAQDEVNVQWLFVSLGLKAMLLKHARQVGADPEVIRRAEDVLHQPTDAPPHADHFHLRIGCAKDDRVDGCLDYGPSWDWGDWHRLDLLARSMEVARAFDDGDRDARIRALEFLDEIKSPFAADIAGVYGFWDSQKDVRDKAMDVAYSQWGWTANALVQVERYLVAGPAEPDHVWRGYNILRRSRDPLARDFALERLADLSVSDDERRRAANVLSHFMDSALVPRLLQELERQPPVVREEIAVVLRRITNRTEGTDWTEATPAAAKAALQNWNAWYQANRMRTRDAWLAAGFAEAGVPVEGAIAPEHIDSLLGLLPTAQPHLVYNANRTVRDLTGRWAPLEQDDGRKLDDYWKDWWAKNRERVLTGDLQPDEDS